ncbi:hypothetical protein Val02_72140 [Virgisporangium aliadipatigenens]|uniref:Uncharacterized protein n=1 Tax=Virgisporangium aliadipatigenens TaxID=741659 RepID=A0A8J3YTT9_9ACTN|nr:hypothetical protein [Virgisporangium aliadipatigenens]GIJ50328.1 hypothetical protein Val02_72140 [Virgisporangium aliadipatigenens]
MTDAATARPAQLHHLLLRLGGRIPDELLTEARDLLALGRPRPAAQIAAAAVRQGWFTPTDAERRLIAGSGAHPANPTGRTTTTERGWTFAPAVPQPGIRTPVVLDLSSTGHLDGGDAAAVAATSRIAGAVALWRAWRAPDDLNPFVVPVFLVSTDAPGDALPAITGTVQEALRCAGINHPQVEVFRPDTHPSPYRSSARSRSALLWAATPPSPVTIARDFDVVDPERGPGFAADHPVLPAGPRKVGILDRLRAGDLLLATTAHETDVLERGRGRVVPQNFRTDGAWIWTDTVTYYLEHHGLSPEPGLLRHIEGRDRLPIAVDAVSRHRALVELFRPVAV